MRRLTLWGARWHQHGLHKSRFGHAPAVSLTLQRPFSFTPIVAERRRQQDVTVRHYEQSTFHSKDRTEIDLEADSQKEQERLKSRIAELEQELGELKEGSFGPNSEFMKQLSDEEKIKALEVIRKYEDEHKGEDEEYDVAEARLNAEFESKLKNETDAMLEEEKQMWDPNKKLKESPSPPKEPFEVELKVPDIHHAYVARFNKTLKVLRKNPTPSQKQDVWRSYRRCKESLPFFLDIIPEEALNMLWTSQLPSTGSERPRTSQWAILAEDILSSGRDLEPHQWLEYIDLLRRDEKPEKALALWKEREDDLNHYSSDQVQKFWQLGVRLFVANVDPENAQDTAMFFLDMDPSHDPRILIPVIICWARESGKRTRAWTLYLHLKTTLGADMNMNDYDAISVGLLNAGQIQLALAVFKDMMLAGKDSSAESSALYKASLGLVGKLHSSTINESDVNKISLTALTILPRKFQNKFFYASWIKKLIGMGEIDAAAKVVELMYERGVNPDPKHLNGLIGAWLREGSPKARKKAEGLAWAMIQERINRFWGENVEKPEISSLDGHEPSVDTPEKTLRAVPSGNIETFSILLLHYSRRDQKHMVDYLTECLAKARIQPNTFFMNHLLYKELRKKNFIGVWSKYKEMTAFVKPDLETFACLWDCGKLQYDRTRNDFDIYFPSARSLYKEMMDWFSNLTPHHKKVAKSEFSKELYDQIIRCFCLSFDAQGTLVALRAMKQTFGFFPDVNTARIMIFLIVRLAPVSEGGPPKPRRRRIASTPRAKENVERVSKLLDILREHKTTSLAEEGLFPREMDEDARKQFEVDLLSDLVRVVLRRVYKNTEKRENSIQTAADEMGVGKVDLGESVDLDL